VTDLEALLDTADLAMVRSEGVLPEDERSELASVVRLARRRLGFLGEILVVAFAGGTGSGKSSLVNALVQETVATASVARPTTGEALGVVPKGSESKYEGLLHDLGVTEIVGVARLKATILVDLPDLDSVEANHRYIAETVLPRVDAVVWVFDPEKYADPVVHRDFLLGLNLYEDQFVFVLNQVDRLGSATSEVTADLRARLLRDGFHSPVVVSSVALESHTDVHQLENTLIGRLKLKRTAISKLATDLKVVANSGWEQVSSLSDDGESDVAVTSVRGLAASTFVLLGVHAREVLYLCEKDE